MYPGEWLLQSMAGAADYLPSSDLRHSIEMDVLR